MKSCLGVDEDGGLGMTPLTMKPGSRGLVCSLPLEKYRKNRDAGNRIRCVVRQGDAGATSRLARVKGQD